MKKFKKWIQKDRYGIVQSCIVLVLLVVICAAVAVNYLYDYRHEAERNSASLAASHASAGLYQFLDDHISKLENAVQALNGGEAKEHVLSVLADYGDYADAAILQNGVYIRADGTLADAEDLVFTQSVSKRGTPASFAQDRDRICMQISFDADCSLAVWIDDRHVQRVFDHVLSGNYDYAVFNSETGAYLFNGTIYEDGGYYDALLNLNSDGKMEGLLEVEDAQVRIARSGSGNGYYIAQHRLELEPWSVALFIPEQLLTELQDNQAPWILIALVLVLVVLIIHNSAMAIRRIRVSNRNAARALNVNEQLMKHASRDTAVTVFMYNRSWNGMLCCYDGLDLWRNAQNGVQGGSLADLAQSCGMVDGELERIYDALGKLAPGASGEVIISCVLQDQDERLLRFTLHASDEDSKSVFCIVNDCTSTQAFEDRIDQENRYLMKMEKKASSIWQIDVSRDKWRLLRRGRHAPQSDLMSRGEGWFGYSDDLSGPVHAKLHPADYESLEESMSIRSMNGAFHTGKMAFECDYRMLVAPGDRYEWHRMQVRMWLDIKTNHLMANLYIFNVDAKKNAELERGERNRVLRQALTALGGVYFGLYYVDLENDLSYTARSLGGELVDQLCLPYKATFDEYIDTAVHPDDRDGVRSLLSAYALRRSMTEGTHHKRREYRRKVADDDYAWSALIVQPARFENGVVKEVVLAIRNIDRKA